MFIIVYVFNEGIPLKKSEILTSVWFLRSYVLSVIFQTQSGYSPIQIWYIYHSWKFESSSSNQSRVTALYVLRNDTL